MKKSHIVFVSIAAGVLLTSFVWIRKRKNMKLVLKRTKKTSTYTEGKLFIDGIYYCDTIEDVERQLNSAADKVYAQTAIPAGQYPVHVTYSPRFGRTMPAVENVPYFTGIRIHSGTTERSSAGCIIVGKKSSDGHLDGSTTKQIAEDLRSKLIKAQESGKEISINII